MSVDADSHYTLGHRRQASQAYDLPTGSMDRTHHNGASVSGPTESLISPLQPFTYDPSAVNLDRYASNASINGFSGSPSTEDGSLDPHDFYRRYQDPFPGPNEAPGAASIVVQKREMTTSREQRKPNAPSQIRTNGTKFPSLSSRMPNSQASPSTDISALSATRSTPNFSNTARNRQTSLRDLVNKFNQTPNEAPPVPSKTQSRSTSTNSNPPANNHARARTASQSMAQPSQGQTPKRRGRTVEETYTGRVTSPRSRRSTADELTSQSMTDLSPGSRGAPRKPLFGEIMLQNLNNVKPGYGIPAPRRRRGSEGSMHSPNPMFTDEKALSVASPPPSSPSAWYRAHAPTLEEIKQEKAFPEMPHSLHRRTRSDFTGIPTGPPTRSYNASHANTDDAPQSSIACLSTRRDSQSRIPLSSRRLSITSDSGNSTPSTRTNSALGRRNPTHIMSPPKGSSALPLPAQQPRSPTSNAQRPSPRKSPRRGDIARDSQRISTSPRLAAFISAPLPKKSPPLRSSRPRQPVSSATTSASRARAVDRYEVGAQKSPSKSSREYKQRRPPELGGVDFAARREKIQRAFTKSVRAEEKRRESVAQEAQAQERNATGDGTQDEYTEHGDVPHNAEITPSQDLRNSEEDVFQTPGEEMPRNEGELSINTGHLSERSVLDLSQEDSPTLGVIGRFGSLNRVSEGNITPTSDFEPSSAVTAGTSDSVDTFFDDEPQEDDEEAEVPVLQPESKSTGPESRTLLSHIMSMRDRSPASPTRMHHPAAVEERLSDRDDRESIQIMLGVTPVLEKPPNLQQVPEETLNEVSASDVPGSRWSVSSWSSVKSKDHERAGLMERMDKYSPPQLRPKDPAHLSSSTVTSESTQQAWSPATFTSPQTERSTMDSDAYSTIDRVLDHYHDPSVVSPKMMHDVQQHIFTQSPDLARQGGWDPKKVTQLYLQQLARERALSRESSLPDPYKYRRKPINPQSPTSAPTIEHKDNNGQTEKILSSTESVSHSRNASLGVDDDDFTLTHRASMNHPDDWDMSPSIADWIAPQAEDSPSDERAPDSSKTWEHARQELAALGTPRSSEIYRPLLPEIEGTGEPLGVAINITSPQEDDSPTIPPPLPDYVPPPPPTESSVDDLSCPQTAPPSMPPSGVEVKSVSSNAAPPRHTAEVPILPIHFSNDSFRRSVTTVSSVPPSGSSFSQERSSAGTQITSPEPARVDPTEQKRLTKRRHIIKELVNTEHSFGQDMKVVDDIYKGTSNVIIISAEDVKTLFSNSDQIVAFSTQFLDALKQASKSVYVLPKSKRWRSNRESNVTTNSLGTDDQSSLHGAEMSDEDKDRRTFIGEAFGHHMANMERVYSEYLKNHDAANQKLQALQKNEKVQIWLKECRAYAHDLTSAWDLDSLLVKPVQRVLKYPLLLDQLLEATPENHPDFAQLDIAAREMKGISMRINEMKKRADIMEQVTNTRKRKESDGRIGLSKAFGRRTEKLRQQVGLSDMVEDAQYSAVSEKFGSHFFQLQVVMRDVEMYTNDVQAFMRRFLDFSHAMEEHIDVAQTSYPESESKWRKFRMSMTEMTVTALTDHASPSPLWCKNATNKLILRRSTPYGKTSLSQ